MAIKNNFKNGKFFIIGIARSGTTLLQQLIASHSQVVGVNETELLKKFSPKIKIKDFVFKIAETEKEYKIVLNRFKKVFGTPLPENIDPYRILDEYCRAHALYFNRPCYVEKSPIHSFFIKGLLSKIPESKVIIVLRDPRAIVASRMFAKKTKRGRKYHLTDGLCFYLNLSIVLFAYKEFERWYHRLNQEFADRLLFVKYEDLVREPEKNMRKIFKFLDLPYENVHENIDPLDMRMEARNIAGVMNSSYGGKEKRDTVSTGSLKKYTKVLTGFQIRFIEECVSEMKLKLFKDFYPSLIKANKRKFKPFLMRIFSNLDHYFFLRKNIKSLEIRT